jgi:hypothetical protein
MTAPVGAQVTPKELADAAGELRTVADTISDAVLRSEEPSMQTPEPYSEVMFGPATEVAAQYAQLTRDIATYVTASATRLRDGADVFGKAATEFERLDAANRLKMGN